MTDTIKIVLMGQGRIRSAAVNLGYEGIAPLVVRTGDGTLYYKTDKLAPVGHFGRLVYSEVPEAVLVR